MFFLQIPPIDKNCRITYITLLYFYYDSFPILGGIVEKSS